MYDNLITLKRGAIEIIKYIAPIIGVLVISTIIIAGFLFHPIVTSIIVILVICYITGAYVEGKEEDERIWKQSQYPRRFHDGTSK